jgi:hypothetical protein
MTPLEQCAVTLFLSQLLSKKLVTTTVCDILKHIQHGSCR